MEGNMSSNLNVTVRKRMGLRKAILSLLAEWKEFEDHFDSSTNPTSQEPLNQLQGEAQESRQANLKVGLDENQVKISQNPMHEKLKEIDFSNGSFDEQAKLLQIEEEKLKERWEILVSKEKEVERIEILCREKLKEIEGKLREVEFSRDFIEVRAKELELKQKELDDGFRDMELKKMEVTENPNKVAGSNAVMASSKFSHRAPPHHLRSKNHSLGESSAVQNGSPNASDSLVANLKHRQPTQPAPSNSRQTFSACCPFCSTKFQYSKDSNDGGLCCPSCSKKIVVNDISPQSSVPQANKGKSDAPGPTLCSIVVNDSSPQSAVPQANKGKSDASGATLCSTRDQPALSQKKRVLKWEAINLGVFATGKSPSFSKENEASRSQKLKGLKRALNAKDLNVSAAVLRTRGKEYQRVSTEDRLCPGANVTPRELGDLGSRKRRRDINLGVGSGERIGTRSCSSGPDPERIGTRSCSSGPDPEKIADNVFSRMMSGLNKIHYPLSDEDGSVSPSKGSKKSRLCVDPLEDGNQETVGNVDVELCNSAGVPPSADPCEGKFELKSNLKLSCSPELDYYVSAEPECSNFTKDKEEKFFSVDQIWACYDCVDSMPRFYAKIRKVQSPEKIQITWLEPQPEGQSEIDWVKTGLPVACGKFLCTSSEETLSNLCFSHQIHVRKLSASHYVIYPRKGETWAIFKDWDIRWKSDPKNHENFQFEMVEVVSNFNNSTGVKVAQLEKVNGFVSLFRRATEVGIPYLRILSCELLRFSHQVPCFRINGFERDGIPKGSFELDPASLPASLTVMCPPEKVNTEIKNRYTISRSCKGQVNPTAGSKKRKTATKFVDGEPVFDPKMQTSRLLRSRTRLAADYSPCSAQKKSSKQLDGFNDQGFTDFGPSKSHASSGPSPLNNSKSILSPASSTDALTSEEVFHDFSRDKSITKFEPGQFWALYTGKDDSSKNYVQIKKVDSSLMIVHAALLESTQTQPSSCGMFTVCKGEPEIFSPSSFSHKVNAKPFAAYKYAICPWKGEIWAMHKCWNDKRAGFDLKDCQFDIVEVLKCNKDNIEVSSLIPRVGFKSVYMAPSRLVWNTDIRKILWSGISIFSHRIPAFQLTGEYGGKLAGCVELDPAALPASMYGAYAR